MPDFHKLPKKNHSFYLFSLRDPYERTISGFVFGHPTNAKALGRDNLEWKRKRSGYFQPTCFATLEEFVQNIGDNPTDFEYPHIARNIVQTNCTNFARAMINGKIQRMNHLFYNYQKLISLLPIPTLDDNNLIIYATRKDHLMDDFIRINRILGEKTKEIIVSRDTIVRDISQVKLPVTRELSRQGQQRLCHALESEYQVYMELLLHAENLNREEVQAELVHSRTHCPDLSILSDSHWKDRLTSQKRNG